MPLSDILRGLRAVWRAWTWFWFRDISAKGTGIMRITMGVMLVMTTIDLFPLLPTLVGPDGVFGWDSARRGMRLARWTWFDHLPNIEAMYVAHALALVANILFMIGFKSRTMGILSVMAHAALYQRNSWFMNGGDRLVREMSFYICLVPCGAAYSVDAWRAKRRALRKGIAATLDPMIPVLSMRMVQLQLCGMYFYSGWQKWNSKTWQKGTALYYSLSSGNYMRSEAIVNPLLDNDTGQAVLKLLTQVTVYWELGFTLLVLWRPTRWLALLVGLGMHVGIHVTLMVAFFSAASVWGYMAFLPYDWVERLEVRWARWRQGSVGTEE